MTMKKKIFYEEYMQRAGGKGREEQKNLYEYEEQRLKYMCYKRKLKKEEWKRLYRICRNERRNR